MAVLSFVYHMEMHYEEMVRRCCFTMKCIPSVCRGSRRGKTGENDGNLSLSPWKMRAGCRALAVLFFAGFFRLRG